ncbi:SDR family oxidoreductase [Streptomyces sp. NPDC050732]|uniref:type I polyketide synthase n=1 Tax=Streptomyces sp. NPDC050732 TaxID=3154632 RepID=UPI003431D5BC
MSDPQEHVRPGDIAVIGMHGRFPGARDCDELWQRISAGDDCVGFYSDEELRAAGVTDELLGDGRYVKSRGGLDDPFGFDHTFFGYSAREGELLDPQQRIFLETASELLDTVGYSGGRQDDPDRPIVGVFAGASMNTYLVNVLARGCDLLSLEGTELMLTNDKDYLPTRVSYKLGLTGPSINVQSGCSTSLVAVHVAVQSLLSAECDIALAGGVSVHVPPRPGYVHQEGLMFSPDGRCRPFDEKAQGAAFGDGVGIVALKRLSEALRDGDEVLAVIKGTAVNNDGARKVGFAAPGAAGQRDVITEAHAVAEVSGRSIGYVEAHGTGTVLGDPVEVAALREAFGSDTADTGFCALGSVKANVGHLAGAAGVTGLIKAVLALRNRQLPPHPHLTRPHPELRLDESPFYLNDRLRPWPSRDAPRRAGVSSFGVGGTNAHAVLEEAPPVHAAAPAPAGPHLIPVSAASPKALRTALERLADRLGTAPADAPALADVAHTLLMGRRTFPYRVAVRGRTHREVAERLRSCAALPHDRAVEFPAPVTLFLGRGPGGPALAGPVAECASVRTVLEHARSLLADAGVAPARAADVIAGALSGRPEPALGELATFLSQYAIATLWLDAGLLPDAVAGAGVGELAAACVTEALPLADALALLARRADLTHGTPTAVERHWAEKTRAQGAGISEGDLAGAVLAVAPDDRRAMAYRAGEISELSLPATGHTGDHVEEHLLDVAAALWTAGHDVCWTEWRDGPRRRVALPPHPLDRRTLVPLPGPPAQQNTADRGAQESSAPHRAEHPEQWLYTESWERAGRLGPVTEPPAASRWLLFEDEGGLGARLRAELAAHGTDAVTVRVGPRFERVGPRAFTLDPGDPDGCRSLFTALAADGTVPDHVVHLWSLDDPDHGGAALPTGAETEQAQERGLYTLLDTAVALSGAARGEAARISVVARHVFDVLGGEPVAPATSTVSAAVRVVPQEFAGLDCRCVDPGPTPPAAAELLAELTVERADETAVALRNGHRWVQRFRPAPAPRPADGTTALRPGGVYLITGGLGGIGLALAGHLAKEYGARLVLTGRTPLPDPASYATWLDTHTPDHPAYAKVTALRELADVAGGLLTVAADVTDRAAMAEAVAEAERRFGAVDGWFHAAGVPFGDAVQWLGATGRDQWRATLAPKVRGALVLEDVFAGRGIDFGCMVSSLASVVGGMGYAAYAAANTFLDSVALGRERRLSVDWEGWTGPNAEPPTGTASDAWRELRSYALSPEEGLRAFDLVLGRVEERRLAVSTVDLETRRRRWAKPVTGAARGAAAEAVGAPDLGPGLDQRLAEVWGEVLHTEIDRYDQSFFDLGGDSLLIVELVLRIEERLGIPLQAADVLQAPTVDHLTARLRGDTDDRNETDDVMARAEQRADLRSRRRAARNNRKDRDA